MNCYKTSTEYEGESAQSIERTRLREVHDQETGVRSRQGQEKFPLLTASRPALGPIHHLTQWVLGTVLRGG
jgi:hypothetical protein